MEVHPGVFVSSTSTDAWRSDPEVGGGAEEHVLSDTGGMRAGLTRFTAKADPDPPPWVLPQTEVLLVLEGDMRNALPVGQRVEVTFRKESGHNVLVDVDYP